MTINLALRIFLPFAFGYFVTSILRGINAVLAPRLVGDLGLSAVELGFATSAFFLGALLFQLPYGLILDRFDPRRAYASALLISGFGAVVVALADGPATLSAGRTLIALGASASAVSAYKVYSLWYAPERLPLVNGLSIAASGLGLMAGTTPVEVALGVVDWRGLHFGVAALLIVSAALVAAVAPAKRAQIAAKSLIEQIMGLGVVFSSRLFWQAAPLMAVVLGTFGGLSSLWAGPWVRDVAGLSGTAAANILLVISAAMTLAGLMTGWLTSVANRLGLSLMGFVAATAVLFLIILGILFAQWIPSPTAALIIWALFGFLAPLNFVTFAALATQFPQELTGRLNACLVLVWMVGATGIQNMYGLVLQRFPSAGGSYSPAGHRWAVGLIIILLVAALAWFIAAARKSGASRPDTAMNAAAD